MKDKLKILFIVRGLPGSGKSTFSKVLGGKHYEADMFFIDESGEYNFDPKRIKGAHMWCQNSVLDAMKKSNETSESTEYDRIVVSNTSTQPWEMEPYFKMAEEHGFFVFSVIVENRHGGRNVHGVPEDKLKEMLDRFDIKLI